MFVFFCYEPGKPKKVKLSSFNEFISNVLEQHNLQHVFILKHTHHTVTSLVKSPYTRNNLQFWGKMAVLNRTICVQWAKIISPWIIQNIDFIESVEVIKHPEPSSRAFRHADLQ